MRKSGLAKILALNSFVLIVPGVSSQITHPPGIQIEIPYINENPMGQEEPPYELIPRNLSISLVDKPRINLTRFPFSGPTNSAIVRFNYYGENVDALYQIIDKNDRFHELDLTGITNEESLRTNDIALNRTQQEWDWNPDIFIPSTYQIRFIDWPNIDLTRFPYSGPTNNMTVQYNQNDKLVTSVYHLTGKTGQFHNLELIETSVDQR